MALQRVETDAIQDDAVTTAKIAANAVAAADISADAITNVKVAAGAAIAVSKITGLGTAATLTAGTAANNVVQLDGSGRLPAVSGANLTGVSTDTSAMENNIAILAFKTQSANNLAKFNLIDQVVDEYKDGTGATYSTAGQTGSTATDGYLSSVIVGGPAIDSYDKLILHSNTTNGSTTFTDSSSSAHGLTAVADAQHTTASLHSGFGTSSIIFDGTGDWVISNSTSADWSFGTGDFTVDFWARTNVTGAHGTFVHNRNATSGAANRWWIGQTAGKIGLNTNAAIITGSTTMSTGTWYHVAFVRSSGTLSCYLNGVSDATAISSYTVDFSPVDKLTIGGSDPSGALAYNGQIDEMRISKGIARWTANFTPPTATYGSTTVNAAGTATSTANTALTAPTTGDICMLIENASGTATLNTAGNDLRCAISRNGGTGWDYVTLVDKGTWGSGTKKILTANNVAFSNSASGTDIRYKIEWANQASGTKETRVHATSLAWA